MAQKHIRPPTSPQPRPAIRASPATTHHHHRAEQPTSPAIVESPHFAPPPTPHFSPATPPVFVGSWPSTYPVELPHPAHRSPRSPRSPQTSAPTHSESPAPATRADGASE